MSFYVKKKILICSRMIKPSMWMSEKEASEVLSIDERSLEGLRERGYLKPGTHWRSSNDPHQLPWKPKVLYCISRCKKVIEYFQNNDSSFDEIAA